MSLFENAFSKAREGWNYRFIKKSGDITEFINKTLSDREFLRKDLAEVLDMTPQQVTNMLKEENNYTLKTLARISSALNIDFNEMLTYSPKRQSSSVLDAKIDAVFEDSSFEFEKTVYSELQCSFPYSDIKNSGMPKAA